MLRVKVLFILSAFLNIIFLITILAYVFTPYFDFAVSHLSLHRMCEYLKIAYQKENKIFPISHNNFCLIVDESFRGSGRLPIIDPIFGKIIKF